MAVLKTPSLQHLARNCHPDHDKVFKALVRLALFPPQFSYAVLSGALEDLMMGIPLEQIARGINAKEKRPKIRALYSEILPLLAMYAKNVTPQFVQQVNRLNYKFGQDLNIPFQLPLKYVGAAGTISLPWFIFWRNNPLTEEQTSLFITIVDELLSQEAGLEDADFHIVELSAPRKGAARRLKVIPSRAIPRLSAQRRDELLEIYAQAFFAARLWLASHPDPRKTKQKRVSDPLQSDLFEIARES